MTTKLCHTQIRMCLIASVQFPVFWKCNESCRIWQTGSLDNIFIMIFCIFNEATPGHWKIPTTSVKQFQVILMSISKQKLLPMLSKMHNFCTVVIIAPIIRCILCEKWKSCKCILNSICNWSITWHSHLSNQLKQAFLITNWEVDTRQPVFIYSTKNWIETLTSNEPTDFCNWKW